MQRRNWNFSIVNLYFLRGRSNMNTCLFHIANAVDLKVSGCWYYFTNPHTSLSFKLIVLLFAPFKGVSYTTSR